MKTRDLCYWLQGYFELSGQTDNEGLTLNDEQINCIRRHVDLVIKTETSPGTFTSWIAGVVTVLQLTKGEINRDPIIRAIKSRLAGEFEHVIDQQYGDDKEEAQEIHDGLMEERARPVFRDYGHGGPDVFMC